MSFEMMIISGIVLFCLYGLACYAMEQIGIANLAEEAVITTESKGDWLHVIIHARPELLKIIQKNDAIVVNLALRIKGQEVFLVRGQYSVCFYNQQPYIYSWVISWIEKDRIIVRIPQRGYKKNIRGIKVPLTVEFLDIHLKTTTKVIPFKNAFLKHHAA